MTNSAIAYILWKKKELMSHHYRHHQQHSNSTENNTSNGNNNIELIQNAKNLQQQYGRVEEQQQQQQQQEEEEVEGKKEISSTKLGITKTRDTTVLLGVPNNNPYISAFIPRTTEVIEELASSSSSATTSKILPSLIQKISNFGAVPYIAGAAAGVADTLINYPPYGLHYRLQKGENISPITNSFVWRGRELYRGSLTYASIIPITCICDGVTDILENHQNHWMGGIPRSVAAPIAGIIAAFLVSAPSSNIIVRQQFLSNYFHSYSEHSSSLLKLKNGGSILYAIRSLYHEGILSSASSSSSSSSSSYVTTSSSTLRKILGIKRFYYGLPPLMIREGIYSTAVFWAPSALQSFLSSSSSSSSSSVTSTVQTLDTPLPINTTTTEQMEEESIGRTLAIGCIVGVVAAILSQPFDTLATFIMNNQHHHHHHHNNIQNDKVLHVHHSTTATTSSRAMRVSTALKLMQQEGGMMRLYKGLLFRGFAVVMGVLVMSSTSSRVKSFFERATSSH